MKELVLFEDDSLPNMMFVWENNICKAVNKATGEIKESYRLGLSTSELSFIYMRDFVNTLIIFYKRSCI